MPTKKSVSAYEHLHNNLFVKEVFEDSVQLASTQIRATSKHNPTNYKIYVYRLGEAIAEVLTAVQGLELIPALLGRFRSGKADPDSGLLNSNIARYHVENYYLRIQILSDRLLTAVDATFNLTNSSRAITWAVVLNNRKVAETSAAKAYQAFCKVCEKQRSTRNKITHEQALVTPTLTTAWAAEMLEHISPEHVSSKDFVSDFVSESKYTFVELNRRLIPKLELLFDALHRQFKEERKRLLS